MVDIYNLFDLFFEFENVVHNHNLKLALNTDGAQDSASTYQYFNDAPISTNSTGFSIVDNGWGSTSGGLAQEHRTLHTTAYESIVRHH